MSKTSSIVLEYTSIITLILCMNTQPAIANNVSMPCTDGANDPFGFCASTTPEGINTAAWKNEHTKSSDPNPPTSPPSLDDQRAQETAEGSASSDARAAGTRYVCDGVTREYSLPDGTAKKLGCLFSSARSGDDTAGVVPTTSEILYYAATGVRLVLLTLR